MTQVTVLHPQDSSSSIRSEIDEFGRSVIDSVVNRKGLSFSIAVTDESEIASISGRLEKFLLLLSAASGGTLARIAPRFSDRPGGYSRIVRLGPRVGDGADVAIIELLGSELEVRKAERVEKEEEKAKKTDAGTDEEAAQKD